MDVSFVEYTSVVQDLRTVEEELVSRFHVVIQPDGKTENFSIFEYYKEIVFKFKRIDPSILQTTHPTFLEGRPHQVNVYKFFYSQYLTNNTSLRDYLQEYLINHQLIEQMENENIIYQGDLCNLIDIFNYQNGLTLKIPPHSRLIIVNFDQSNFEDIEYYVGESDIGVNSQPEFESYTDEGRDIGHNELRDDGRHTENVGEQFGSYGWGDVGGSSYHNFEVDNGQGTHSETGDYGSDQGSYHEVNEQMSSDPRGSDISSHRRHRGSRSDVGSHRNHHASGSSSSRSSRGNGKRGGFRDGKGNS
uniref:Uncharacterized protein n=1 Tax=Meloidogyne enterolobii TaxID=390850 RepID=A0A6V7W876_MELEN|nr:unnamed protein product [Meloidogyne enterolobii]